ncbi:MAG: hypothetical protein JJU28_10385 [Cyclobacteriaceae bacterium]|nr:hypothetical protein [Cyclobacteriaceae bacterium]
MLLKYYSHLLKAKISSAGIAAGTKRIWLLCLVAGIFACSGNQNTEDSSTSFIRDKHTVILWLFDEDPYPNAVITDASPYELSDLFLISGKLTEGKFGNALISSENFNVMFANYPGQSALQPRKPDGVPTGMWGPTYMPEGLLRTLAEKDITFECWLKPDQRPEREVYIADIGLGYRDGLSLRIKEAGKTLEVRNHYKGHKYLFLLPDEFYHPDQFVHMAIEMDHAGKGSLYIDGRETSKAKALALATTVLPEFMPWGTFFVHDWGWPDLSVEERKSLRFNVALLQDRKADQPFRGALDELRISDTLRFAGKNFTPQSYSRNHSAFAFRKPTPTGPPLLLSEKALANYDPINNPLLFGKRKHVFIDDKILEAGQMHNATIVAMQLNLEDAEKTDIEKVDGEWRISFVQDGDRKLGIASASSLGTVFLYETHDGLHFKGRQVEIVKYPMGGDLFIDNSPEALENGTRFKYTSRVYGRGVFLYTSRDAVHWQRNETALLPLLSGGSAETFYDDQQGKYVIYLRRDVSFVNPEALNPGKRHAVRFETDDPYRVWPFKKMAAPYFEYGIYPAVTGEGEPQFLLSEGAPEYPQAYRTRVIKYPYAPDTYLAFPWIYHAQSDHRDVALARSRDGNDWDILPRPYYVVKGEYKEVLSCQGLHRQGDELWQYMELGGKHGRGEREWYRFKLRLDGFFALKSDGPEGKVTTKTLITDGDKLQVNYFAAGSGGLSVEILDEKGSVIPGFSAEDCKPLKGDDIAGEVQWQNARFDSLKGKKIKLRFAMDNTEIYAFEVL